MVLLYPRSCSLPLKWGVKRGAKRNEEWDYWVNGELPQMDHASWSITSFKNLPRINFESQIKPSKPSQVIETGDL